jgi:serine/threonine-protein kinase
MSAPADAAAIPVAEGEIVAGKYRVERVLGRGGMGVVVAAEHLRLSQRVAIKFLLSTAGPEAVKRFEREARAAVRLKSDHVARVLDVGELPTGAPYMVMEYLDGDDLSKIVRERGPLAVADAVDYLLQACEAVAEAHALGIVHRDLKPANLFVTTGADRSVVVKVLDFGISKQLGDAPGVHGDVALTQTASILGSPLYMSPEQLRSTRSVDFRTDIWSLGTILYQLLAGRVPFNATALPDLVLMVAGEAPPPLGEFRAGVPPPLEAAIRRCLEKDPAQRFQTVSDLAWAIAPFGSPSAQASAERIARTLGVAGGRSPSRAPTPVPTGGASPALASSAPAVVSEPTGVARPAHRRDMAVMILSGVAVLSLGASALLFLFARWDRSGETETSDSAAAPSAAPPPPQISPAVQAAPVESAPPPDTASAALAPTQAPSASAARAPSSAATTPRGTPSARPPPSATATATPTSSNPLVDMRLQ